MDRHNHRLFSCWYTSVKRLSIFLDASVYCLTGDLIQRKRDRDCGTCTTFDIYLKISVLTKNLYIQWVAHIELIIIIKKEMQKQMKESQKALKIKMEKGDWKETGLIKAALNTWQVQIFSSYNCHPLKRRIGPWSTRSKRINVSHFNHVKLGFVYNETLPPRRPTRNAARWRVRWMTPCMSQQEK